MKELTVFLCNERAGRLILKPNGNLQFRYDAGYKGPPISQSLPLQDVAHGHAVCHAVFGGLLLEGQPREVLARNLGVSAQNDFALLEAIGGDCAGSISLLSPGQELPVTSGIRRLSQTELEITIEELPQHPLAADPEHGIRLSLAGAQQKLPVIVDPDGYALPTNSAAPTTHIIKPEPERFPGLVDNEFFCLSLAAASGFEVPDVARQATTSGRCYLVVSRYDRDFNTSPIARLHQEDFCQALGHPSEAKYQSEGGPSLRNCMQLLLDCSTQPVEDSRQFWRAAVFNWLVGNCDAHGKNFSILYRPRPCLAPLYDLVSTTIYPELTTRLAMNIGKAKHANEVKLADWLTLGSQVKLAQRFVEEQTREVVERVKHEARNLASKLEHRNEVAQAIASRIAELQL